MALGKGKQLNDFTIIFDILYLIGLVGNVPGTTSFTHCSQVMCCLVKSASLQNRKLPVIGE